MYVNYKVHGHLHNRGTIARKFVKSTAPETHIEHYEMDVHYLIVLFCENPWVIVWLKGNFINGNFLPLWDAEYWTNLMVYQDYHFTLYKQTNGSINEVPVASVRYKEDFDVFSKNHGLEKTFELHFKVIDDNA